MLHLSPFLKTGITLAILKELGTSPVDSDMLNICVSGKAKVFICLFSSLELMKLLLQAFFMSKQFTKQVTSISVTGSTKILFAIGGPK